jgi:hypothetical protein
MTEITWNHQKARLIDRFGDRNFSKEFSLLVATECRSMPDVAFVDMVNAMIGSRRSNDPPLLQDFRNGRIAVENRAFHADVNGAMNTMNQSWSKGVKEYLAKEFPGCKILNEAVEVRKLQIRLAKIENPNYDPMTDPKWN